MLITGGCLEHISNNLPKLVVGGGLLPILPNPSFFVRVMETVVVSKLQSQFHCSKISAVVRPSQREDGHVLDLYWPVCECGGDRDFAPGVFAYVA